MEPERIGPADLFTGLAERVQQWRREQPWYPLLRSDDPDEYARGRELFLAAWESLAAEARTAGAKYLATKDYTEGAQLMEELGVGAALAELVRRPEQTPGQRAMQTWWTRGKKPVVLLLSARGQAALVPAAWAVYRAKGRLVTAGEFGRKQFDDAWLQRMLSKRLVAIVDVHAGPVDAKGYFENTLREFIQLRCSSGTKTVLTTPLDRSAWLSTAGAGLRTLLAEVCDGQDQRTKVTDRRVEVDVDGPEEDGGTP